MTATPNTAALKALLAKVEAGDEDGVMQATRALGSAARDVGDLFPGHDIMKAFGGSLDAAKALHEAVLPGWIVVQMCQLMEVDAVCNYTGGIDGWLVEVSPIMGNVDEGSGTAQDPARAWLIATLRALLSAPVTPEKEGE